MMMSRSRIMLALLSALLLAALLGLWLMRRPIASDVIDNYLAKSHIPASYELVQVGPQDQLLRNVVLGDPARPDLIARELRINLGWGLKGVRVERIQAIGLRLRAKLDAQGTLSLGSLDRLRPKPSDEPFSLPAYDVDLADSAMELATPWGKLVAGLNGRGPLPGGFDGRLVIRSHGLQYQDCALSRMNAPLRVRTQSGRIHIAGQIAALNGVCKEQDLALTAPLLRPDIWLAHDLNGWNGAIRGQAAELRQGQHRLIGLEGNLTANADRLDDMKGKFRLSNMAAQFGDIGAIKGRISLTGDYALSPKAKSLTARLAATSLGLDTQMLRPVHTALAGAKATPIAGIAADLDNALRRASQSLDLSADINFIDAAAQKTLRLDQVQISSASGLNAITNKLALDLRTNALTSEGFSLNGGGFPDTRFDMAPWRFGAANSGTLTIAPLRHGRERLVLTPVQLRGLGSGNVQVDTRITLDGDFPGGRVDGLNLPVALQIGDHIRLGRGCVPLRFTRLAAAGAIFGPSQMRACPTNGPALLRSGGKQGLAGGFAIAAPRLIGRMGDSPINIAAEKLSVPLVPLSFRLDGPSITIGTGEDPHRFTFAQLNGRFDSTGVAGAFTTLSAKVSAIPLLMTEGSGQWNMRQGVLGAKGDVRVADAATNDPRFRPLLARGIELSLRDNVIRAHGSLRHPASGTQIVDVDILHDLDSAIGHADLTVPGIYFRTDGLQPDMLTSTTLGVIANVRGDVTGHGRIDWTPKSITSTGLFGTENMDFAAAFGPINGFATQVTFTDLLGITSAPGQKITIRNVNPGMEVLDGLIQYQLLPGNRLQIEGGRWPFNGGFLTLDPSILDLNKSMERRLAFRVEGLDAAKFIQQLGYQNISASGIFDGVIPMIFDDRGGRIEGGYLVARQGGGSVAYVGELTRAQLGSMGKMAFDALRSLRYQSLTIELNGTLDGDIITRVKFDGLAQEPIRPGVKMPFSGTLKKLPFRFNISIRAPFRSLLNQAEMMSNPQRMIRSYMPMPMTNIPGITP